MSIAVTAPANPVLSATLTAAQVAEFTALVGGIPAGKSARALVLQVKPDGTGQLQVQTQTTPVADPVPVS